MSENHVPADVPMTDAAPPESHLQFPPDTPQPVPETSPRPVQMQADGTWHQPALPTPTENCSEKEEEQPSFENGNLADPDVSAQQRNERKGLDTLIVPPLVESFVHRPMRGPTGDVSRTRESRSRSQGMGRGAEAALVPETGTGSAMEVDGEEAPRSTVGLRVDTQGQALSTTPLHKHKQGSSDALCLYRVDLKVDSIGLDTR